MKLNLKISIRCKKEGSEFVQRCSTFHIKTDLQRVDSCYFISRGSNLLTS